LSVEFFFFSNELLERGFEYLFLLFK